MSALLGKNTDLWEEHRGHLSCWEQRGVCAAEDIKALPEILVQFLTLPTSGGAEDITTERYRHCLVDLSRVHDGENG